MLKTPELSMPRTNKVTTVCNGNREVWTDYEEAKAQIRTEYLENQKNEKTYMMDGISLEKEQPEKEN